AFLRVLRSRQVGANTIEERLGVGKRQRKRAQVCCRRSLDEQRDGNEPHREGHTFLRRSAARSSVSSRLAKQKRRIGPASTPYRNDEGGIEATPCSLRSHIATSVSASVLI